MPPSSRPSVACVALVGVVLGALGCAEQTTSTPPPPEPPPSSDVRTYRALRPDGSPMVTATLRDGRIDIAFDDVRRAWSLEEDRVVPLGETTLRHRITGDGFEQVSSDGPPFFGVVLREDGFDAYEQRGLDVDRVRGTGDEVRGQSSDVRLGEVNGAAAYEVRALGQRVGWIEGTAGAAPAWQWALEMYPPTLRMLRVVLHDELARRGQTVSVARATELWVARMDRACRGGAAGACDEVAAWRHDQGTPAAR